MISFVGAGPGAADLLTLRGADRLARADVTDCPATYLATLVVPPVR
ncbi:MAG: hypothetical protein QOG82_2385 [Actinomycetota bacterium]|jgi:precorrin-4/cobalt-precorrin-4 C11-methyltransferase|nr:hypothetical protein [Actinomycetota bacterium]